MKRTTVSERALVLAPKGRDSAIAAAMLREADIKAFSCASLTALIEALDAGAGFVVVTEEAVDTADLHPLAAWLADQEEWSDLPFILLTRGGGGLERNPAAGRYLDLLRNVTFLERPFHPTTLVSLAKSALRARRRQYEARARLIALRESETRYRTLFDTMDEGFCVIRFEDGPHGPLSDYVHIEANSAYDRHAGIPDAVGKSVRELVPDEADGWIDLYRRVLVSGESIRFDRELVATGRHLDLAAFRVEPASRREVAVIFQDVTERRLAERQLLELNETLERRVEEALEERRTAMAQLHEAQKLETIGQLTGGVAHDMNNLLTPITGALDLIGRRYSEGDPRTARLIDGALQSAERAKQLVSRLLGFARRQSLQTLPVDLAETLNGMGDLIRSSIGPGIELNIVVPPNLPSALADPNQLELALLNLCVNARDAMPNGGALTLAVESIVADPNATSNLRPGAYLRIAVVDTGVGMDAETLAKAVEPFFSTKALGKGTGLGLSMVHGLAAQLGGAFTLASQPGRGTRADLYLPIAGALAEPARRGVPRRMDNIRSLTLLLVDDEDIVRQGTAEMLRDLGHVVHDANGGAQALAKLSAGLIVDVVITDYMMPRMNGAELAERIRALSPAPAVLVVTGYAGGDLDPGLPQLAKPFRQADIAAAIESVVYGDGNVVPISKGKR